MSEGGSDLVRPPSFASFKPSRPPRTSQPSASRASASEYPPSLNPASTSTFDDKKGKAREERHSSAREEPRPGHHIDGSRIANDDRRPSRKHRQDSDRSRYSKKRDHREGRHSERSSHRKEGSSASPHEVRSERKAESSSRHGRSQPSSHDKYAHNGSGSKRPHRSPSPESVPSRRLRRSSPPSYSSHHPKPEAPEQSAPTFDRDIYFTDARGDQHTARYGLDGYKVPTFDRGGDGRVLGLDPAFRIPRRSMKLRGGENLEVTDKSSLSSRRSERSTVSWNVLKAPGRRFLPQDAVGDLDHEDFIAVARTRSRARTEGFSVLGNILADMDHRHGPGRREQDTDSEGSGSSGDSLDAVDDPHASVKARSRDLHSRLRDEPTNVALWLDLVDLQDRLVSFGEQDEVMIGQRRRKDEQLAREASTHMRRQATYDVRFTILEKAISAHPDNRVSLPLILSRLQLATRTGRWDSERLEKEWRKTLDDPRLTSDVQVTAALWKEYLTWRRGDWTSFELDSVRDAHAEAISALTKTCLAHQNDPVRLDQLDGALISVAKSFLASLEEAGLREHAFAALQALLEVNICATAVPRTATSSDPADGDPQPFSSTLENFEKFWESERPRLMESGATGWGASSPDPAQEMLESSEEAIATASLADQEQHPVGRWLDAELRRANLRRFSARLCELPQWQLEGDELDPFSTVIFTDLRPILFRIGGPRGKLALLDLACSFLGLPSGLVLGLHESIEPLEGSEVEGNRFLGTAVEMHAVDLESGFWPSSLRMPHSAGAEKPFQYVEGQMMDRERKSNLSDPILRSRISIEGLFALSSGAGSSVARILHATDEESLTLARRLLEQVSMYLRADAIPVLRLALESASSSKAGAKLARKLLSEDRDNLILWHAYAQLELRTGKPSSARNIYITALESSAAEKSDVLSSAHFLPQIWSALVELLWTSGETSGALAAIGAANKCGFSRPASGLALRQALEASSTPAGLEALHVRRTLALLVESTLDDPGSRRIPPQAAHHVIFCAALFGYLVVPKGQGFQAAMSVFDEHIKLLHRRQESSNSLWTAEILERLIIKRSDFMQIYVASGQSFRPADVRRTLDESLAVAPANVQLWSHLAAHEMRSKIDNHLRLALDRHLSRQESITTAKSLLQSSLADQGRGSANATPSITPWLFAIYVELNLHSDHFNEHAIRRLFERAVESEPGSGSGMLWSTYLTFETRLLESKQSKSASRKDLKQQQSRTKSLLYRAVKACPGCKSIYLFAFRVPLRSVMELEEISSLYEVMCEKEIRLFVDLEVFLDQWRRDLPAAGGEAEDSSNDDQDRNHTHGQDQDYSRDHDHDDDDDEDEAEMKVDDEDSDFDDPFDPNKPYRKRDDQYEQVGGGRSRRARTGLHSLPVELLYSIFVLARSPALPIASRGLRQVFHEAPLGVRVEYVLELWHWMHLKNFGYWRDKGFDACRCTHASHSRPPPAFWDRSSILTAGTLATCCPRHVPPAAVVDPISFAARFGICTADLVVRLEMRLVQIPGIHEVLQDHRKRLAGLGTALPSLAELATRSSDAVVLSKVEIPKRMFRALKHAEVGPVPSKKRSHREMEDGSTLSPTLDTGLPEGYPPSLLSLLPGFLATSTQTIGTLPSPTSLSLLLLLLSRYHADPTSHQGFPLAMSAHSDCWTLVHVLLAYGADPARKNHLAVQIAVRKGGIDGVRLLVEREARLQRRWERAVRGVAAWAEAKVQTWASSKVGGGSFPSNEVGLPPPPPQQQPQAGGDDPTRPPDEREGGDASKRRRLPDRVEPGGTLLREAVKAGAWDVVHYLMNEKRVVPDLKTLKLLDEKGGM